MCGLHPKSNGIMWVKSKARRENEAPRVTPEIQDPKAPRVTPAKPDPKALLALMAKLLSKEQTITPQRTG